MNKVVPAEAGAEAFIELLNANEVEYIFLNSGTDTVPVQEAIAKFKAQGKCTPEVVLCLHESVAMSAAHGHFMVSGRPQVVLVHVDAGTQNVGGALHNAQRGQIGVVFCAGRAPIDLEKDELGGRWFFMWIQDRRDQTSIVRDYVKWDYELRSTDTMHRVVQRAFQLAATEPCGPVYLTLPLELIIEKVDGVCIPDVARHATVTSPQADPVLLDKAAEILVNAEKPLIMTGKSGRNHEAVKALVELAETLGARVITSPDRMNFPTLHPLCSGEHAAPHLGEADAVLVIDLEVPYAPTQSKPKPDAKIIHIDLDPIKPAIPMWVFPVDILLKADSSKAMPELTGIIRQKLNSKQKLKIKTRSQQVENENKKLREEWRQLAVTQADDKPISPEWLCHCINEVIDEDTILLNEAVTNMPSVGRQVHRTKPGTSFDSGGSSLGWGLGAALGAKLAAKDKTVVTLVGDGSFVFGCPTAALWAAHANKAPFLTIIFNNQKYQAVKGALRRAYGKESFSEREKSVGIDINEPPEYSLIAKACHSWGEVIEDPSELKSALKKALTQVRNGKSVVLDVKVESEVKASFFS